jgi:anti-sigma-K factor RskA
MATDTQYGMNACPKYEAILEDYLEGALDADESIAAEKHWRECAGCRAALDQASASVRLLRFAGPSAGPGPAFARTVMARIRAAESDLAQSWERAGFWQPLVKLGWRFAATATLVLGVLVTYDAGWGHHDQRAAANPRLMGGNDIFAPDPANPPANRDEVLMMVADTNHGN